MGLQSHQAPVPVDDTIELSDQEFEERSNKNVERWVSLHIIPVCGLYAHPRKTQLTRLYFQESHISLPSRTYPTLLEGKTVTFKEISEDPAVPEWKRVSVNGNIQIVSRKEVRSLYLVFLPILTSPILKATNGVLYVVDGTIQDD
jgi:hypothetical protein